jgi:hypothetical protein
MLKREQQKSTILEGEMNVYGEHADWNSGFELVRSSKQNPLWVFLPYKGVTKREWCCDRMFYIVGWFAHV